MDGSARDPAGPRPTAGPLAPRPRRRAAPPPPRLCHPRYRGLGLVVYPYYTVVELLGPVVEAVGLAAVLAGFAFGAVDGTFAMLFLAVAYGWGLLLNLAALLFEEFSYRRYRRWSDLLVLLAWSVVEGIGYRQLTVVWRLRGLWGYLRGRTAWGTMSRRGFETAREPLQASQATHHDAS